MSKDLFPAIIQNYLTGEVLMLGYMNEETLKLSEQTKLVTFFSRSQNKIWVKGETSGNFLDFKSYAWDCDQDTVLVQAIPRGPTCHTGTSNCFKFDAPFLLKLENIIKSRKTADPKSSYTAQLFSEGVNRVSQKVGEEATEVVIESISGNKEKILSESADLLFHLIILLQNHDLSLAEVIGVLDQRHKKDK